MQKQANIERNIVRNKRTFKNVETSDKRNKRMQKHRLLKQMNAETSTVRNRRIKNRARWNKRIQKQANVEINEAKKNGEKKNNKRNKREQKVYEHSETVLRVFINHFICGWLYEFLELYI